MVALVQTSRLLQQIDNKSAHVNKVQATEEHCRSEAGLVVLWRRNVHVAGRDLWLRLENGRLHVIDWWYLVHGVTEIPGSGAVESS